MLPVFQILPEVWIGLAHTVWIEDFKPSQIASKHPKTHCNPMIVVGLYLSNLRSIIHSEFPNRDRISVTFNLDSKLTQLVTHRINSETFFEIEGFESRDTSLSGKENTHNHKTHTHVGHIFKINLKISTCFQTSLLESRCVQSRCAPIRLVFETKNLQTFKKLIVSLLGVGANIFYMDPSPMECEKTCYIAQSRSIPFNSQFLVWIVIFSRQYLKRLVVVIFNRNSKFCHFTQSDINVWLAHQIPDHFDQKTVWQEWGNLQKSSKILTGTLSIHPDFGALNASRMNRNRKRSPCRLHMHSELFDPSSKIGNRSFFHTVVSRDDNSPLLIECGKCREKSR